MDVLEKFKVLFEGRDDAYGQYPRPEQQLAGQKRLAPGRRTVARGNQGYEPLTDQVWQAHLDGTVGLGIVPVRTDAHVGYFVLDVDKYTITELHQKLVKQIEALGLPLVVTRSKSGGAHVWCFLARPIPAIEAIQIAKEWKTKLGLDNFGNKCEIFPKQDSVATMDVGSWINLPYFGGDNLYDHRFCVGPRGQQLNLEEFLRFAAARRANSVPEDLGRMGEEITPDLAGPAAGVNPALMEHQQAPPCVRHMLANGVNEGSRNNAVYQMAIYLQRAFQDDWRERLDRFNQDQVDPPLGFQEMGKTAASMSRGYATWRYKCDEHAHICDKAACASVAYGVGTVRKIGKDMIQKVISIDNPDGERYFVFEVDGGRSFMVTASGMQTQRAFETGYLNATGKTFKFPRGLKWRDATEQLLEIAENRMAEDAITNPGLMIDAFRDWVSAQGGYHGKAALESLREGCAVYLPDTKEIVFKASAFKSRMERTGIRLEPHALWSIMEKHLKVKHKTIRVEKNSVRVISSPCEEPWFDVDAGNTEDEL